MPGPKDNGHTDFKSSNNYSFKFNPILEEFYNMFFCENVSIKNIEVVTDKKRQKEGIDKVISLSNGDVYYVDDKIREKDYGDILIEEWSNYEMRHIGWGFDNELKTDYIFYFISGKNKCYVMEHKSIVDFMKRNYDELKALRNNSTTKTYDGGYYTTTFMVIPFKRLRQEINVWEYTL